MAYAVWACLGVIVATGVAMSGPPPTNPGAAEPDREYSAAVSSQYEEEGNEENESEEVLEEVHEIAVDVLYALIALHLLGVLFETRRSGREVIGAMLPGGNRKRS